MAVVVVAVGLARAPAAGRAAPAEIAAALGLALEFLLAAGLLRLSAIEHVRELAAVAVIVLMRRALSFGLQSALRALDADRFRRLRA
jgi:uncharacterized membrane protein